MITEARLIAAIRDEAAADPERVYDDKPTDGNCSYIPNSANPRGCLIGAALLALGVPRERLEVIDAMLDGPGAQDTSWGSGYVRQRLADLVEHDALWSSWAARVQGAQDEKLTWSEAVRAADIPPVSEED